MTFNILTPAEVRFLTKYDTWAKKVHLADKLETALLSPQYIGSFADDAAANLSKHPGLAVGSFFPGDRYYNTGSSTFRTNTAAVVGAATWTVG